MVFLKKSFKNVNFREKKISRQQKKHAKLQSMQSVQFDSWAEQGDHFKIGFVLKLALSLLCPTILYSL